VTLLSVSGLTVLSAGAWWWVTWPERTALHFIELINTEDLTSARQMLTSESIPLQFIPRPRAGNDEHRGEPWAIEPLPRSVWDILTGRQEFKKPKRARARLIGLTPKSDAADGWISTAMFDYAGKVVVYRGSITTYWDMPGSDDTAEIRLQRKKLLQVYDSEKL
jgi:hypothetical protein